MPKVPSGSGSIVDRVRERVQRELNPGGTSNTPPPGPPADPAFLSRIRELTHQQVGTDPTQPPPPKAPDPYQGPPRSLEEVKARIQAAGRQRPPKLLRMLYNGNWRDTEPYSFRWRDADDPQIPLFFGYCHKDDHIEAYKLKKIQDLQVTNRPFQERWVCEF